MTRRRKPRRAPRQRHLFADDGTRDVLGRAGVAGACCPLPRRHPVHQLPDAGDAMTEHRRRTGDRDHR